MCDISKVLCIFAQIIEKIDNVFEKIDNETTFYLYVMGHFCRRNRECGTSLHGRLVWLDWLHARHRGFAESYQQIRHAGVLCRREGAWYMEPEQGKPYRDSLQEDVTLFNKGTRCHGG